MCVCVIYNPELRIGGYLSGMEEEGSRPTLKGAVTEHTKEDHRPVQGAPGALQHAERHCGVF